MLKITFLAVFFAACVAAFGGMSMATNKPFNPDQVIRFVGYSAKPDSDLEAWRGVWNTIASVFPTEVKGWVSVDMSFTSETDVAFSMVFDNQAMLDDFKTTLREKYIGLLMPFLAGPATFDVEGPLYERSMVNPEATKWPLEPQVIRFISYRAKADADLAAWKDLWDTISYNYPQEAKGWVSVDMSFTSATDVTLAMKYQNQAMLDTFMANLREKYLSQLMPFLAGGPIIDTVGPVSPLSMKA